MVVIWTERLFLEQLLGRLHLPHRLEESFQPLSLPPAAHGERESPTDSEVHHLTCPVPSNSSGFSGKENPMTLRVSLQGCVVLCCLVLLNTALITDFCPSLAPWVHLAGISSCCFLDVTLWVPRRWHVLFLYPLGTLLLQATPSLFI